MVNVHHDQRWEMLAENRIRIPIGEDGEDGEHTAILYSAVAEFATLSFNLWFYVSPNTIAKFRLLHGDDYIYSTLIDKVSN